jgi:hypothetical protein
VGSRKTIPLSKSLAAVLETDVLDHDVNFDDDDGFEPIRQAWNGKSLVVEGDVTGHGGLHQALIELSNRCDDLGEGKDPIGSDEKKLYRRATKGFADLAVKVRKAGAAVAEERGRKDQERRQAWDASVDLESKLSESTDRIIEIEDGAPERYSGERNQLSAVVGAIHKVQEDRQQDLPLTEKEQKTLGLANVFYMDHVCDSLPVPAEIAAVSELRRALTPREARVLLRWFYATAPGTYG